jgi:DNA (cytosine-5)-methyltransferase 1
MSYGFHAAKAAGLRFDVCGALDIDPYACQTYERMLGVKPINGDVRDLTAAAGLRKAVGQWKLDGSPLVLIGCAPCQGFSSHRKKDPREDSRNQLLDAFAEVACRLKPNLVIMENVPEMLREEHWAHFQAWRETMEAAGYTVRARIYNLAQFGVPQERFRALVFAARDWRHFRMPEPRLLPTSYRTVRDAIGGLPPLDAGGQDPLDPMHVTSKHREQTINLIRMVPLDGGSRRSLPTGVGPDCLTKVDGFRDVYGRLSWDKPSVAITARCRTPSCGRFVHPTQHRGLSVREAALLQGFPPEFHFEGPFDDKFKQIGNAVSPVFSQAVAEHVAAIWGEDHSTPLPTSATEGDVVRPFTKSFSSRIAAIKRRQRQVIPGQLALAVLP